MVIMVLLPKDNLQTEDVIDMQTKFDKKDVDMLRERFNKLIYKFKDSSYFLGDPIMTMENLNEQKYIKISTNILAI